MLKKVLLWSSILSLATFSAMAEDTQISGIVQPKCSIFTDHHGVYGAPGPSTLSTASSDGGVEPIVRIDVASADFYIGKITTPNSFASSPSLNDSVTWTGDVNVSSVSDSNMSGYDAAKTTYDNVHEYDLTIAGTTWFAISSQADYGVGKAFPAGNYSAIVTAECIAK